MKLPLSWLSDYTSIDGISPREYDAALTMSGSKVEEVVNLGAEIDNVVVGRIAEMVRHPNSDHMWVCQIDVGTEMTQICTGAWNIHTGDLIPTAKHKSTLPGGIKITKGKLRGELSNGMLCSLKELGLDTHNAPYAVIQAAAILNDYTCPKGEKPSLPETLTPGAKLFGKVVTAKVLAVKTTGYSQYALTVDLGGGAESVSTSCANIHEDDFVAVDTGRGTVCTLADLRARQEEFPHCIEDGIFVLNEADAKPGDDIRKILGLDELVAEFEITSNRPDCMSVIGLARETAATFSRPLNIPTPAVKGCGGDIREQLSVEVLEPVLCPRYTAKLVKNIKIEPSPAWMRQRLHAAGVRPINNIVDITNYVMLEYGQPMHAFDYACLSDGRIVVRRPQPGEAIQTLDGQSRAITPEMLAICDGSRPVAIAGVMGGANSEITEETRTVVFESACFHGPTVRITAKSLGMRTEASGRFEKGLDPKNTMPAVLRACELVEQLDAGEVIDGVIDVDFSDAEPKTLPFEPEKMNTLLGLDLSADEQAQILERLYFKVADGKVTIPSFRTDIARMCDLAEEVARIYGYNKIPTRLYAGETVQGGLTPRQLMERTAGDVCLSAGFDQSMTFSFVSPKVYDSIALPADDPRRLSVTITNPLGEDFSVMRTTVLPSLLGSLAHNYAHRNPSVSLYEAGTVYHPVVTDGKVDASQLPQEERILTLGSYGRLEFYAFKGVIEAICRRLNVTGVSFTPDSENPSYHPGRCAKVWSGDTLLGCFGTVHPTVAKGFGLSGEVLAAELALDALYACAETVKLYQPLPKFPASTRDIAVLVDDSIPVAKLEAAIRGAAGSILENVTLFDVYKGSQVPEGKKSAAYSLCLRASDRTLTDEECDAAMQKAVRALETEFHAVLRG